MANSQPWQWRLTRGGLELYADQTRRLAVTDPHGRSLLLSCGATLHHLRLAMAAQGWSADVKRIPDPRLPALLASIAFAPTEPTSQELALASAIAERRSDRRPMSSWPVDPQHVASLVAAAADQGALLAPLDSAVDTALWERLGADVMRGYAGDPAYERELQRWSGSRDGDPDGVPAANVPEGSSTSDDPFGRFSSGDLQASTPETEQPGWIPLLLATSSDDALSELRAGEALSAVLLEATRIGLATRVDSRAVERDATRGVVESRLLGGTRCPQVLIVVGWPSGVSDVPEVPRRDAEEVFKSVDTAGMVPHLGSP